MRGMAISALVCVAAASSALAQGTITDGGVSLTTVGTPFGGTNGNANLTGVAPTDPLFFNGWGYRQTSNLGTNRVMGGFGVQGQTYTGDTSVVSFLNNGAGPAGVARFNAIFTTRLEDTAAGARIYTDVTITNINSTTLVLDLFQVVDFDLNGGPLNDVGAQVPTVGGITLSQTDGPATASLFSTNATGFSVGGSTPLRSLLNTGFANLNGSTAFAGDTALGLQWTLTLAAGQSVTISSLIGFGEIVPAPSAVALLGLGGLVATRRRR